MDNILFESEGGVAILKLNRPDKLNALDPKILDELSDVIKTIDKDDNVKCAILTGAGRAFCSGIDLASPVIATDSRQPGLTRRERITPFAKLGNAINSLTTFSKPLIAALNGPTVGAGLSMAIACDIRIASSEAKFSAVFVKRGLVADTGCTFLLPRILGLSKALELMWTGNIIDANEALRLGLVSYAVPPETLMSEAVKLAISIAQGPSLAIEAMKRMAYAGLRANDFASAVAYESFSQNVMAFTEDVTEGKKAFFEKRQPKFQGK